jgi:hypothetical protein
MSGSESIGGLLERLGIHPVLVEVGPRERSPRIWDGIAEASTYLAVGPDAALSESFLRKKFDKVHVVDEVVSPDAGADASRLYVTTDPVYSTLLRPKHTSRQQDFIGNPCLLEDSIEVSTTTIGGLVRRLGLPTIDWLDTNVNGLDFRLYQSLDAGLRRRLLALDTVVDIVDFWNERGSPVSAIDALADDGFWVSDVSSYGLPRMRPETVRRLRAIDPGYGEELFAGRLPKAPGWLFVRAFRTIESLAADEAPQRDYVVLWAFALLDGQVGYAADVVFACQDVFGEDPVFRAMLDETLWGIRSLEPATPRAAFDVRHLVPRSVRRTLRRYSLQLSKAGER